MYNEKIVQIFQNPTNVGVLQGHNAQGTTTNSRTNEIIRLYLLINDNKVQEAKFKAFGGVNCIAMCSVVCDILMGKSIEAIENIDVIDFARALGQLPDNSGDLIAQIRQTIALAVADYYKRVAKEQKK